MAIETSFFCDSPAKTKYVSNEIEGVNSRAILSNMNTQTSILEHLQDAGLLLLRVVPSGIMMTHGWPKMIRLIDQWGSADGVKFFDFMGMGPEVSLILTVLGELVAPAFMIVGFKTRWAAIPAAFTMGVAAFVVHGGDPLGDKELALLYLVSFAAVAALGGGRWSIDGASMGREIQGENP